MTANQNNDEWQWTEAGKSVKTAVFEVPLEFLLFSSPITDQEYACKKNET